MKAKILLMVCLLATTFAGVNSSRASDDESIYMVGDVVLARPGCFLATLIGSAVFIVALPFALTSHSVKHTANILVVAPAQATFTRPLGDFSTLQ